MKFKVENESELNNVVTEILQQHPTTKIFLFTGNLGAGKTTMIKYFANQLGYIGKVQSPTYGLVNEYNTANKTIIYHFDLYRLKNLNEAIDIGLEDYLYSNNYCFIEWYNVVEQLLPNNCIVINIDVDRHLRVITCSVLQ
jgi:tRNA threonylcarbamoyladenosine biosynthesis protein TsaE